MNRTRLVLRTSAAALAVAAFAAVPVAAHADPTWPWATTPAYSVIDTAALPLASTAQWSAVTGHDTTIGALEGIVRCSVDRQPPSGDLGSRVQATSPTYFAWLNPTGDAAGWEGSIAAATYPGVDAASHALAAYRRYLDACKTAPERADQFRNAAVGTSALDPTQAHALIETADTWMEVFAVATNDAVVELVFNHPKDGPLSFDYNPAAVFAALKMADIGALAQPLS
ncbi:Uncharacterised protein [Mycobacteroides abscessus subsp. abscessus]|uniref:hypothetical protein n=1 Tax=Mycobacteroides abscessus TaxID=36809 RepID=UPI00092CB2F2|nr:hypothetical protein [Mycobacteroides abscessus]SIM25809.1 Uncharacterised protein [Mycobacteroides abscessus subsp. abscessus]SLC78772.1 Uncharacterised protein [Mycobacteroides abscessus subsp. abscessus]